MAMDGALLWSKMCEEIVELSWKRILWVFAHNMIGYYDCKLLTAQG
jgi:hypothetical protein